MSTVSKSTMKSLQQNFDHINDLPLVKKLNKKISKLKKENKSLQRVIMHFGESLQNIKPIEVVDLACDSDEYSLEPLSMEVVGKGYDKQSSDTKVVKLEHVDLKVESESSDEEHIVYHIEEEELQKSLSLAAQVKEEFQQSNTLEEEEEA